MNKFNRPFNIHNCPCIDKIFINNKHANFEMKKNVFPIRNPLTADLFIY